MTTTQHTSMANHWWWRPGWSVGRRFYTWHLTVGDQPDVQRYAAVYRDALAHLPGLDPIPDQWLHLTMQGLGFINEVDEHEVQAITAAAQSRLADLPPLELNLTDVTVTPEAVLAPAQPADAVTAVRNTIRAAIADVWPSIPEAPDGFRPHVSIAYSNAQAPAEPVYQALSTVNTAPATAARIAAADLIVIHRDRRMYEWETYAQAPIG
ncbi:2'-5' RNA ligase family protein [Streptomyces sp. NEAU-Y11]|uniref:2'-5' RNA ligase family protein n=1 Tax=Streptomyces cucumeris TaxID=2962890 RepID=UPI0020C8B83C|nr:2'-5' RNA ligase family protein [Streptomyces sp. NEAU-Y11]MCP9211449.1 2'-5' RNA ligase family protein [Streptomyces sp. NEAU-Y11]